MYEYSAEIIRWIDGDSVILNVDLGFRLHREDSFRLLGINTPELRGSDRPRGLQAKAYVEAAAPVGSTVLIRTEKAGKYGRWLCTILTENNRELIKDMLADGVGVPFMT